jgi:hypothetical protein
MDDIIIKNLADLLTASNIAVNWKDRSIYQKEPLVLQNYFPSKKVPGLTVSYLKGYREVPGMLQPAAFDAKPVVGSFELNMDRQDMDMFFFRESYFLPEKLRQDIGNFLARSLQYASDLLQQAIQNNVNFVDKALTATEFMRAGAITEGKFSIASSDADGRRVINQFNYDPKSLWHSNGVNYVVLTGTARWMGENANENDFDPVKQLDARMKALKELNGAVITDVLLNSTTFDAMCESVRIRQYLNPVGYGNTLTLDGDIRTFIEKKLSIRFVLVDRVYKDMNTHRITKFFPDGYVVLLPGAVGRTAYGTTPEEYDLLGDPTLGVSASQKADVAIVNTGVAITTKVEPGPPVKPMTTVSQVVAPTFEDMESVCSMRVF